MSATEKRPERTRRFADAFANGSGWVAVALAVVLVAAVAVLVGA
jgi:hypothetical protein